MADRSKSLQRLAAVQKQMVRLAEWRMAAAERSCRELSEDKLRLQTYVVEAGALGVPMARAALKSLGGLDRRLAEAEHLRASSEAALAKARLREQAADDLAARVARAEQRVADDRALAATVETWLVVQAESDDTSLR